MLPAKVLQNFISQAKACDTLGSPFTARVCRALPDLLDENTRTGKRVAQWPGDPLADALTLRLTGGLHALVLTGADAALAKAYPPHDAGDSELTDALSAALSQNDAFLHDFLDSAPQTNEVARAGMLMPGMLLIARETGLPLALCEIGSSAGLNLSLDRFRYDYAGHVWGDERSALVLSPDVRGAPPPLGGDLRIASRAGSDIAPVEIADPAQRLRLRAYVWADQTARLTRIEAAIGIAEAEGVRVEKADAADFVRQQLGKRRAGEVFVLYHSIMWQYMPQASKNGVMAALEDAAAEATDKSPIARLRMEPLGEAGHATLSLTLWPGEETRRLAKCDFHGRWIEWL